MIRVSEVEGLYRCLEKIQSFDPEVRNLTPHAHNGQAEEYTFVCCYWRLIETEKRSAQPYIDQIDNNYCEI